MLRAQALSLKQDTLILSLFSVVPNEKSCLVYQAMGRKLDGSIFVLVEKQAQVWYTNCPLLETVLLLLHKFTGFRHFCQDYHQQSENQQRRIRKIHPASNEGRWT